MEHMQTWPVIFKVVTHKKQPLQETCKVVTYKKLSLQETCKGLFWSFYRIVLTAPKEGIGGADVCKYGCCAEIGRA